MPAIMLIEQLGLGPGTAGKSREDGTADGKKVTLTSVGVGTTHSFSLLWAPEDDDTVSLVTTSFQTSEFFPKPNVYGTYRIKLVVDEGLPTEDIEIRTFSILTPNFGLRIPALNEQADPNASLVNNTAVEVDACEHNVPGIGRYASGNYGGWAPALRKLFTTVDNISGKLQAAIVVGNSVAGDTANSVDYLDTGDGAQLKAAILAAGGKDVFIRPGTYDLAAGGETDYILVPDNTKLVGAGVGATVIKTRTAGADQGVFSVGANCVLQNVQFDLVDPVSTAAVVTDAVVKLTGTNTVLRDLRFVVTGTWGATESTNSLLDYLVFGASTADGSRVESCDFEYNGATDLVSDITAIEIQATGCFCTNNRLFLGSVASGHASKVFANGLVLGSPSVDVIASTNHLSLASTPLTDSGTNNQVFGNILT